MEDRPADLGAPQRFVSGLVAADDIELAQGTLYAEGMFRHVSP